MVVAGCGYQFAETKTLSGGISSVAVHTLTNRTRQSGLEILVTNAIISEFTRHRQAVVVGEAQAQAVLSGTIRSLFTDPVTRTSTSQVSERNVTIEVALMLKAKDGRVIWQDVFRASQTYAVSADGALSENLRQAAMEKVADKLAEQTYLDLGHAF